MMSYAIAQRTRATLRLPSRGIIVVGCATLAMGVGFGGLSLFSILMAPMEAELGWTRAQTSFGYALSTAGMAAGALAWGRVADRIDIRALFVLGGGSIALALLALASVHSLGLFYLICLLYGAMGFSTIYSPLLSTTSEWFPERRGLVIGIVTAGGALGQGLLPFGGSLLMQIFGWRIGLAAIGLIISLLLAICLPWLRWPHGTRARQSHVAADSQRPNSERLRVRLLAAAAFMCCACMGVPLVHMVSFVGTICGSPVMGVTSLLVAMCAGTIGRVCFGLLADHIGPLASYAIASVVQTLCVLLFPTLNDSQSLLTLSAVFGAGFAGNMTCLSLCVRQAVPAQRFGGSLGAVMLMAWSGMAAGGYTGGYLYDLTLGYGVAFILAGVAGCLNLLVLAIVGLRMRQQVVATSRQRGIPIQ